jgi:hypothetical protein
MEHEVIFRIILESPTPGVDFGLQKGRGSAYEAVQKQRSNGDNLQFQFIVKYKPGKNNDIVLSGPFVQGAPGGRFVYIDIGTYAGQKYYTRGRPLKITLSGITPVMIDQLLSDPGLIFETSVPGTGKDGGPNCATVKPFHGWILKQK